MKRLMIICALLVSQVQSAESDQQLEKLEKSRRIAQELKRLQRSYQLSCQFGDALAQNIHFLFKADDDIIWLDDNFGLSEIFDQDELKQLNPYIDFMHGMREKLKEFLRSFQEFSEAEKLAFSPFYYHSQVNWGTFPDPTIPEPKKITSFCTYLYRIFVTPRDNCKSVLSAMKGVIASLNLLQTIQTQNEQHFSSLKSATTGMGIGENCVVQTYEMMIPSYIAAYRGCIAYREGLLSNALTLLKEELKKVKDFSDAEKMMNTTIHNERMYDKMRH
ncbi:MAG: hypothetical protein OXC30_01110 [Alphaproteobacteria bacterium]|nr:hypothetical protein [Alphaproteobacteria bacterium]